MSTSLDAYLGMHPAALRLREQRTELLARNLANADTPGYIERDLDPYSFDNQLKSVASVTTSTTSPMHISVSSNGGTGGFDSRLGHFKRRHHEMIISGSFSKP